MLYSSVPSSSFVTNTIIFGDSSCVFGIIYKHLPHWLYTPAVVVERPKQAALQWLYRLYGPACDSPFCHFLSFSPIYRRLASWLVVSWGATGGHENRLPQIWGALGKWARGRKTLPILNSWEIHSAIAAMYMYWFWWWSESGGGGGGGGRLSGWSLAEEEEDVVAVCLCVVIASWLCGWLFFPVEGCSHCADDFGQQMLGRLNKNEKRGKKCI